jgi:putative RecB family exonuclease
VTVPVHPSASAVHLPVVRPAGATSYSRLQRFAQCPRAYRLHYLDRLPPEPSPESQLGVVLHETLETVVRDHVRAGRHAPLDAAAASAAYRRAWTDSALSDHGVFVEGLELVQRWLAREGTLDARDVLAVEHEFDIAIGTARLVGAFDRVDRIGADAIRVRDYKSGRRPPSRQEVDESLQLAIYDLAARQLWPWARRVELGLDLLRHDKVVTTERTDEQRDATRQYVLATLARIEAESDFAPRLGTLCTHCDHRLHCPAYADALAAKRTWCAAVDGDDLGAVAREREQLAAWLKIVGTRKDALDELLTRRLAEQDELLLEGRRYRLVTAARKDYPLGAALDALTSAGMDREEALARVARVDAAALKRHLDELGVRIDPGRLSALKATLDASAKWTLSTRLTSTEVRS